MQFWVYVYFPISEVFSMGKLHKDLATYIVQCAEDETKSNQVLIKVSFVFHCMQSLNIQSQIIILLINPVSSSNKLHRDCTLTVYYNNKQNILLQNDGLLFFIFFCYPVDY